MPEVSRFFGIVISMYYNDHPPPHFHVRYGGQKALIEIDALTLGKVNFRHACWEWWSNGRLYIG